MNIFKSLETYIYTMIGAAVLTATAHNPALHDVSIWFLGVLGHAIGIANGKSQPPPAGVPAGSPVGSNGAPS